ncbi:MAG: hypothetical protein RSF39_06755 [Romboutsia sp.]
MKNKISKIILVLPIAILIVMAIYLGISTKVDYNLVDISGDKKELGNVSVLFQERHGAYKTSEVKVSKDGMDVDKFSKEVSGRVEINNFTKDNRDILDGVYNQNEIYKSDDSVGYISLYIGHGENNYKSEIYIDEKNLENNKTKNYKIPIEIGDIKEYEEYGYDISVVPIKYNDDLYVAIGINKGGEIIVYNNGEGENSISKESFMSVYKLNLEDETSEIIFNEQIVDGNNELARISNIICFSNDNSAYFVKEICEKDGVNYKLKYELLRYNLENKKLSKVEIPVKNIEGEHLNQYSVAQNRVTFTKERFTSNNEMEIYKTTVDLDSEKVIESNEKYIIKLEDSRSTFILNQVKSIDGKLYLIIHSTNGQEDEYSSRGIFNSDVYTYVIDEKSKDTLYCGKIKEGKGNVSHISILSEDEL